MSDAKFNIKSLVSSSLLVQQYTYDNDFSSGFHIEAETSNAKFNITPLASISLLSLTIHL